MRTKAPSRSSRGGFVILEAVLAVGIAGIMITGVSLAMRNITRLGYQSKREAVVGRIIANELQLVSTKPRITEGQLPSKLIKEWEIEIISEVTELTDVTNQDGAILNRLFEIKVEASWWEDGGYVTRSAETWRHADLYAR